LPHALHAHVLQLDQPGRTLVRLPHRRPAAPQRSPQRASTRERHPNLGHSVEQETRAIRVDQDRGTDPRITRPTYGANLGRGTLAVVRRWARRRGPLELPSLADKRNEDHHEEA